VSRGQPRRGCGGAEPLTALASSRTAVLTVLTVCVVLAAGAAGCNKAPEAAQGAAKTPAGAEAAAATTGGGEPGAANAAATNAAASNAAASNPRQAMLGRWHVARARVEASDAYVALAKVDPAGAKRMLDALSLLTLQISDRELRIEGPGPARRVFFEVGAVTGSTIELKPTGKGAPMTIEVRDSELILQDRANKLPLILRPAPAAAPKPAPAVDNAKPPPPGDTAKPQGS
jgi:Fe2+ transport system protein FeoA